MPQETKFRCAGCPACDDPTEIAKECALHAVDHERLKLLVERIYRMCVNQLAEPEEFDTAVLMVIATIIEEVMPGPANAADAYTGI